MSENGNGIDRVESVAAGGKFNPPKKPMMARRLNNDVLAKLFLLTMLVAPIVTYAIPENALMRWSAAATYADFVARYVPAIDKLTAISQFPQVTKLFMALLWGIVVPFFFVMCLFISPKANSLRKMQAPAWVIVIAPLCVIAMCWMILFLPFVDATSRVELLCNATPFDEGICLLSDSRLWLGIISTAFSCALAIFAAAMLHWPAIIRAFYLQK